MAGQPQGIKQIKAEEPEKLMLEYKETGDISLRNALVMHYINLVDIAIYGMRSIMLSGIPYEDFFGQGTLALIDCIERYDPNRGANFQTYSYMGIRGSILKFARKQNWIPNSAWDARKKITKGTAELEQSLLRSPTDKEIAEHVGMSEKELSKRLMEISAVETVSFEEMLEDAFERVMQSGSIKDGGVDRSLLEEEFAVALGAAIEALPPKQRQIITLYYYENMNLREIGEILELTQQRVSQLRKKALDTMQEALEEFRQIYEG